MKTYIIADTHLNHEKIKTYCDRPANFTERIVRNWQQTVKPEDLVVHVGDVFIGKAEGWDAIWPILPGRKVLVRGNHDWGRSASWWMDHGFAFACDSAKVGRVYFSHYPAEKLPEHCDVNIHGHLHNIWHGFHGGDQEEETRPIFERRELPQPWHRLFAVEYTDYRPVELQKFLTHPIQYQAIGETTIVDNQLAKVRSQLFRTFEKTAATADLDAYFSRCVQDVDTVWRMREQNVTKR